MSKQKPLGSEQGRELRRLIWGYVGAARRYEAERKELRCSGCTTELINASCHESAREACRTMDELYAYINELTDWDR
jgi:hypothetical protein